MIVGRLFEQYASGQGSTVITDQLNRETIPAPRGRNRWRLGAVLYILKNPLYRGEDLWKRHKNTVKKGKARHEARPEQDWERRTDETLRIVSDDLWNTVQERRASRTRTIPRSPRTGTLSGRPSWFDGHSNHLVTGFAQCGVCGGNLRINHQRRGPSGKGKVRRVLKMYRCGTHEQSGKSVCSNNILVPQGAFDDALLVALRGVLNPDVITAALTKAIAQLRRDQAGSVDRRAQIDKDVAAVRKKIDRLMDALTDESLPTSEIKSRLKVEKQRQDALEAEREGLAEAGTVASLDVARITKDLKAKVYDVSSLLGEGENVSAARGMLRKILVGPIVVSPIAQGETRGFRFEGRASVAKLLSGEVLNACRVVAPTPIGSGTAGTVRWTCGSIWSRRRRRWLQTGR